MEETEVSNIPGRVLVEPVEFVDLREIAKGKHGSHRASPERDLPIKKAAKDVPPHKDHSYNCLQIALQKDVSSVSMRESKNIPQETSSRPITRTPSKDEVLSVVIQKLTELVKNSEKQQSDGFDQSPVEGSESGQGVPPVKGSSTRLYQCPRCPCLFAVKVPKKGKLCSCCTQDSRSTSPEQPVSDEKESEAYCLRDGKDHGGIACDLCSVTVNSYNDLLYHLATHDANIFRCKFCNFVTTRHAAIEGHQNVHVTERAKKCVCNICGFKTCEFSKLQSHMKTEHQNIKDILLKCSECGYSTKSESALRDHMWTHIRPDQGITSPKHADNENGTQQSCSPKNFETEETCMADNTAPSRKEPKKSMQSAELFDANAKLFKCLLCGYLCEKLSTLKAHAWRHAGQEGCSYPVMHKVQDVSQITAEEPSKGEGDNAEREAKVNIIHKDETVCRESDDQDPTGKIAKEKYGCHCHPIRLPVEEHQIVQKVFADATSADPEEPCKVSSTIGASQVKVDSPTSSTVSVIKKVPDKAKNMDAVRVEETQPSVTASHLEGDSKLEGDCADIHNRPAESPSLQDNNVPILMDCADVATEVVITATVEGGDSDDVHPAQLETFDQIEPSGTADAKVVKSSDTDVEEVEVTKEHGRKPKRKIDCTPHSKDVKKICIEPGISKMLLNAVDDALQTRAENERKVQTNPSSPVTQAVDAKDQSVVKIIAAIANQNYQCPICQQVFPSSIQTHVCSQGSTPMFKCHRCPATFWHLGRLQYHMATHEAILKCSKCPFSCHSEMALRDHVKKAHLPAKSSICPTCQNDIGEQSPKAHEQSCKLKCWYGCRECDFVSTSMEELQTHGQDTHQKPYKCIMCDYSSATLNGIKNHMKFHNSDKPYKCNLCDFSGAYPQSLRSHMKKHSASSPSQSNDQYKCKFCPYTSGHLPSMKSHMWRHTSHPGYDYDGQDIIKMVVKIKDGRRKSSNKPAKVSSKIPVPDVEQLVVAPVIKSPKVTKGLPKTQSFPTAEKAKEPPKSKQIQYGSVIFQCSQCGFKSNDHSCLVEHLRGHLKVGVEGEKCK